MSISCFAGQAATRTEDSLADEDLESQRRALLESLMRFSTAQNELGRLFARNQQMHPTDAAAVVHIIAGEDRGLPLTPARLAERIGLTTGATSILLNRLEEAGHIIREGGHRDRRIVTLHSSPSIHATANAYYEPLARLLSDALGSHSASDLAVIQVVVDRVITTMDAYMAGQEAAARPDSSADRTATK